MKKTIITALISLGATGSYAQNQNKANFCVHQALQLQKTAAEINELAINGKISPSEYSVLLEMLNNNYKGYLAICPEK